MEYDYNWINSYHLEKKIIAVIVRLRKVHRSSGLLIVYWRPRHSSVLFCRRSSTSSCSWSRSWIHVLFPNFAESANTCICHVSCKLNEPRLHPRPHGCMWSHTRSAECSCCTQNINSERDRKTRGPCSSHQSCFRDSCRLATEKVLLGAKITTLSSKNWTFIARFISAWSSSRYGADTIRCLPERAMGAVQVQIWRRERDGDAHSGLCKFSQCTRTRWSMAPPYSSIYGSTHRFPQSWEVTFWPATVWSVTCIVHT